MPYPGGAPAVNALLGGHLIAVIANYSEVMEHFRSGKLRPLAVTTRERIASLPDVPTIAESGYKEAESVTWNGIVAPAKTPKETIAQLSTLFTSALAAPDVGSRLISQGIYPAPKCGDEFGAQLKEEHSYFAHFVRELNIKGE